MLETITEKISYFVSQIPPMISFVLVILVGMIVFWRVSIETRKNITSIFDIFIVSAVLGGIVSRISYIIIHWSEFNEFVWYWLPYEKYGDTIYFFRLLPWRFFNIWDGGLVIFTMFLGFVFTSTFLVLLYKRWKWKQMFFAVYYAGVSILGISTLLIGVGQSNQIWIIQGILLTVGLILALAIYKLTDGMNSKETKKKYIVGIPQLILTLATGIYVFLSYSKQELHIVEEVSNYIFLTWLIIASIMYIVDLRKVSVSIESISSVRSMEGTEVNKPIKLP